MNAMRVAAPIGFALLAAACASAAPDSSPEHGPTDAPPSTELIPINRCFLNQCSPGCNPCTGWTSCARPPGQFSGAECDACGGYDQPPCANGPNAGTCQSGVYPIYNNTCCESAPSGCTAVSVTNSIDGAGSVTITCSSTGNGIYNIFFTSAQATGLGSPAGPWYEWQNTANACSPSAGVGGCFPFWGTQLVFPALDEDNGISGFPNGQILATYVEVCAQDAVCAAGDEGIPGSKCVVIPVTPYQP